MSQVRMNVPEAEVRAGRPTESKATPPPGEPNVGRDEQGKFTAGNKGGPGNPFARQVAAIR